MEDQNLLVGRIGDASSSPGRYDEMGRAVVISSGGWIDFEHRHSVFTFA